MSIDNTITQYLKMDTQYALMINGKYGTGKTYYIKHRFPEIAQEEGFKTMFISLFGLTSTVEIKEKIFNKMLSSKVEKITNNTLSILSAIGYIARLSEITELVNKNKGAIAKRIKSWVNKENDAKKHVLIFDDLDRKDEKLSWDNLYGFLNDLTENHNIKIILIINEYAIKEGA